MALRKGACVGSLTNNWVGCWSDGTATCRACHRPVPVTIPRLGLGHDREGAYMAQHLPSGVEIFEKHSDKDIKIMEWTG